MPLDYYPQKSVDELLSLLATVQRRATGGAITMTQAAGVQMQRSVTGSPSASLEMRRLLYSLYRRDPVTYTDPYIDRVRRTMPSYVGR